MAEFNVLIEKDEDGTYVSIERTRETIALYLRCSAEMKIKEKFVGLQKLEV